MLENVLIKIMLDNRTKFYYNLSMKQWTPKEIREFRKRLDLYQKDFASLLGVTGRYVSMLEKGVKEAGETLKKLLDCLEEKSKRMKRKGGSIL